LEANVARRYRAVLLLCGAVLFASLVLTIGPATVLASFRELSWRLLLVIAFPCVVLKTFDTLAWRFALPRGRVPFLPLASAVLAGHAVASATPTSMIGGNATMAWTLRDRVSLRESFSSLIIVQTTSTASQGLFLLLGILIARWTLPSSATLLRVMEWLLVLEVFGVVGFVAVQMGGIMSRGYGLLRRLGFSGSLDLGKAATHVDAALVAFYRTQPRRLALSLLCNLLGWFTRAAEVWLILYLIHAAVSMTVALTIEAFGTGIGFATFFLPLDLGVDEGATVATFLALGLSGGLGLSVALVRRIREGAWVALGLLLLVGKPAPSRAALEQQAA
jgi:uncharacterized protein (TIRG00374 family)